MRTILIAALGLTLIGLVPTAAADDLPTGTGVDGRCIVLFDFPDAGYAICKGTGDCLISERRTTFTGTEETCLVPR